jgi:hypothetical protein
LFSETRDAVLSDNFKGIADFCTVFFESWRTICSTLCQAFRDDASSNNHAGSAAETSYLAQSTQTKVPATVNFGKSGFLLKLALAHKGGFGTSFTHAAREMDISCLGTRLPVVEFQVQQPGNRCKKIA